VGDVAGVLVKVARGTRVAVGVAVGAADEMQALSAAAQMMTTGNQRARATPAERDIGTSCRGNAGSIVEEKVGDVNAAVAPSVLTRRCCPAIVAPSDQMAGGGL